MNKTNTRSTTNNKERRERSSPVPSVAASFLMSLLLFLSLFLCGCEKRVSLEEIHALLGSAKRLVLLKEGNVLTSGCIVLNERCSINLFTLKPITGAEGDDTWEARRGASSNNSLCPCLHSIIEWNYWLVRNEFQCLVCRWLLGLAFVVLASSTHVFLAETPKRQLNYPYHPESSSLVLRPWTGKMYWTKARREGRSLVEDTVYTRICCINTHSYHKLTLRCKLTSNSTVIYHNPTRPMMPTSWALFFYNIDIISQNCHKKKLKATLVLYKSTTREEVGLKLLGKT